MIGEVRLDRPHRQRSDERAGELRSVPPAPTSSTWPASTSYSRSMTGAAFVSSVQRRFSRTIRRAANTPSSSCRRTPPRRARAARGRLPRAAPWRRPPSRAAGGTSPHGSRAREDGAAVRALRHAAALELVQVAPRVIGEIPDSASSPDTDTLPCWRRRCAIRRAAHGGGSSRSSGWDTTRQRCALPRSAGPARGRRTAARPRPRRRRNRHLEHERVSVAAPALAISPRTERYVARAHSSSPG